MRTEPSTSETLIPPLATMVEKDFFSTGNIIALIDAQTALTSDIGSRTSDFGPNGR
ncbi:MAG: hypothetical protein V1694_12755 [Candidatus Eisenbacteria bacterium]